MPAAAVSAFQAANPAVATVARSTQTTVVPVAPDAPFTRQSRMAQSMGFSKSYSFGGRMTEELTPVGGYLRALSLTINASGGSGGGAVLAADAPFNILGNNIQLKDPTGNPLLNVDSFSLYLMNLFSGMGSLGQAGRQNPTAQPSYTAPDANGNFNLRLIAPIEFDSSGYGSLPNMNASANFVLQTVLAGASEVFSTAPSGLPQLVIQCNLLFWTIPQGNPLAAPPDVGSSSQWTVTTAGQNPTTSASLRARHPSPGTWIHTLIAVLRDATAARVNGFPATDLSLWIDDYPQRNSILLDELSDTVWKQFGIVQQEDQGVAKTNVKTQGVICFSFRTAVQEEVGTADTSDGLLPTAPSTKLEIGGTWGTITNSPGQLSFLTGWLYPANANRLPWTHLAS